MTVLNEEMIERRAKGTPFDKIETLNVWGCDIHDINIIRTLPNLTVLVLSMNNINNLEPLRNLIKLETLYLRQNQIENIRQLNYLQTLPKLAFLWLSGNPFCEPLGDNYRREVLRLMPNLTSLDTIKVTPEEIQEIMLADHDQDLRNEAAFAEIEASTQEEIAAATLSAPQNSIYGTSTIQNSTQNSTSFSSGMYFPLLRSVFTNLNEARAPRTYNERLRHVHSYMDLRRLPADYGYEGYTRNPCGYFMANQEMDRVRRSDIIEAAINLLVLLESRNLHRFDESISRILMETRMLRD